ncbi:MAG: DUF357 domain-containing protein [Candidatus Pacearchaeota archaeon]
MKNYLTKKIIKEKLAFTKKALEIAEKKINKTEEAEEILKMVKSYLEDSIYFLKKKDYINSFGAIYYAHGWLDCGARLKIFDVEDSRFFSI